MENQNEYHEDGRLPLLRSKIIATEEKLVAIELDIEELPIEKCDRRQELLGYKEDMKKAYEYLKQEYNWIRQGII